MPNTTLLSSGALSRYKNRNGTISWKVSGWLAGVRIRKNFKTREEAAAENPVLQVRFSQLDAGIRSTAKFLTLREWTKLRRIAQYRVGHFVYSDADEVAPDVTYTHDRMGRLETVTDVAGTRQFLPDETYGKLLILEEDLDTTGTGRPRGFHRAGLYLAAPDRDLATGRQRHHGRTDRPLRMAGQRAGQPVRATMSVP